MAVYKDEARGTWYVSCGYKDWTGKPHHMTKRGFASKTAAKKWEANFIAQSGKRLDMLFRDFVEIYRKDRQPRLKESTWDTKQFIIDTKILPYFGDRRLCDITSADVVAWQNELMAERDALGTGYSQTYLRTVNNQLSAIFNHAVRYYGLGSSPAKAAGKMGSRKAGEMSFWTRDEYLRFSEAVMDKPVSFYAFEVLFWTGIREGELLALTPSDIDFGRRTLRVNKTYHREGGRDVVTPPKTPKGDRVIALPAFLAEELREYERYRGPMEAGERLFPVTKHFLRHEMERGCAASGVKRIRIHDLRHSHVSMLIELGFDATAIADRLGHESVDVTYQYAHLFPNKQVVMADVLDRYEKGEEP